MERITQYTWQSPEGRTQTEHYYVDGEVPLVLLYTNGHAPSDDEIQKLRDGKQLSEAGYRAQFLFDILKNRNYEKLYYINKILYDFLNARLGA